MSGWRVAVGAAVVVLGAGTAGAEPGVTDSEIVLGCSTSLSGPLAFAGEQATKFGVDVFFKALNDAGGIHGRRVRAVYYDDGYQPERALANTKKLVEQDKVFAVIAPLGMSAGRATVDYLEQKRVPLLFPLDGPPTLRGRRYIFPGTMLYDRQSRMMIDYLVDRRGFKRFGALYHDDAYSQGFLAAFERDLRRHGLKMVAAEVVKSYGTDISRPIGKLRAATPQVTFLVLTPAAAGQALRERQKIGWNETVMVSVGPLTDTRYLTMAGAAAEGVEGLVLWPEPGRAALDALRLYRQRIEKSFPDHFTKSGPNPYSLFGYVAAMLFTEAAKRVGRDLSREQLIAALEGIREFNSEFLPPISIGPDHETEKQAMWARLEQGRLKPITDWLRSE